MKKATPYLIWLLIFAISGAIFGFWGALICTVAAILLWNLLQIVVVFVVAILLEIFDGIHDKVKELKKRKRRC